MDVHSELFELQDLKYKEFHTKLIPNIEPDTVIGIRIPVLRKFSKDFRKNIGCEDFLNSLPHKYYDENNLHAFIICDIKNYDDCIKELNKFLPYVDNWATCDSIRPKCFKNNTEKLIHEIEEWLGSEHTYTVRFAIEMLMTFYLESNFKAEYLGRVSKIKSDEYYINMMISWYFATALAKQWESAVKFIEERKLPLWVHKKTIQKAVESYRITDEEKTYLKSLKIKN